MFFRVRRRLSGRKVSDGCNNRIARERLINLHSSSFLRRRVNVVSARSVTRSRVIGIPYERKERVARKARDESETRRAVINSFRPFVCTSGFWISAAAPLCTCQSCGTDVRSSHIIHARARSPAANPPFSFCEREDFLSLSLRPPPLSVLQRARVRIYISISAAENGRYTPSFLVSERRK